MQHTLTDLLERNAFAALQAPPSSAPAEIRRAADQARLESEMGLRTTPIAEIEAAQQALAAEPGRFEMRVFAPWAGDPRLVALAYAHDDMLARVSAVLHTPTDVTGPALSQWLAFGQIPNLLEALGEFAPEDLDPPAFWGEVAGEIVKTGTSRGGRPAPVALLERMLADGWADPAPVCGVVTESALSRLDDVLQQLEKSRRPSDGVVDLAAVAILDASFGQAFGEARRLVELLSAAPASAMASAQATFERAMSQIKRTTDTLTTAFHNAGEYARAEKIVLDTMQLPYGPADRESLDEELRIVRLVRWRTRATDAINRRDLPAAIVALERIVATTPDQEERRTATGLLGQARERQREAERPALVRSFRQHPVTYIFIGVVALIVAVSAIWNAISGAISGDSSSSAPAAALTPFAGSTASRAAATAASSPSSDLYVATVVAGDCIGDIDAGENRGKKVPCGSPASGKVLKVGTLTGALYPSDDELERQAALICPAETTVFFHPTPDSWILGSRRLLCIQE